MSEPTDRSDAPPLTGESDESRTWWKRNRWWFLPSLLISPVVLCGLPCGGLLYVTMTTIKDHPLYQLATIEVETNPQVSETLGSPVTVTSYAPIVRHANSQSLRTGPLTLEFDVRGPRGAAKVTASGSLHGDEWLLESLNVEPDNGAEIEPGP